MEDKCVSHLATKRFQLEDVTSLTEVARRRRFNFTSKVVPKSKLVRPSWSIENTIAPPDTLIPHPSRLHDYKGRKVSGDPPPDMVGFLPKIQILKSKVKPDLPRKHSGFGDPITPDTQFELRVFDRSEQMNKPLQVQLLWQENAKKFFSEENGNLKLDKPFLAGLRVAKGKAYSDDLDDAVTVFLSFRHDIYKTKPYVLEIGDVDDDENSTVIKNISNAIPLNEALDIETKKALKLGKKLSVRCLGIGNNAVHHVFNVLSEQRGITELNLFGNGLFDEGCGVVAQFLRNSSTIKKIELGLNSIREKGIKLIGRSLKHCPSLETIDLSLNDISLASAKHLKHSLRLPAVNVTSLQLWNTHMGDEGFKLLLEGIRTNRTRRSVIRNLGLRKNQLSIDSMTIFGKFLASPDCKMREINLRFNLLGNFGIAILFFYLPENSSLEVIDVSNNAVGVLGAEMIASNLKKLTRLSELVCSNNMYGPPGSALLSDATEAILAEQPRRTLNVRSSKSMVYPTYSMEPFCVKIEKAIRKYAAKEKSAADLHVWEMALFANRSRFMSERRQKDESESLRIGWCRDRAKLVREKIALVELERVALKEEYAFDKWCALLQEKGDEETGILKAQEFDETSPEYLEKYEYFRPRRISFPVEILNAAIEYDDVVVEELEPPLSSRDDIWSDSDSELEDDEDDKPQETFKFKTVSKKTEFKRQVYTFADSKFTPGEFLDMVLANQTIPIPQDDTKYARKLTFLKRQPTALAVKDAMLGAVPKMRAEEEQRKEEQAAREKRENAEKGTTKAAK